MTSIFRCLKAEFLKCKHSVLLYIHILIPLLGSYHFCWVFSGFRLGCPNKG